MDKRFTFTINPLSAGKRLDQAITLYCLDGAIDFSRSSLKSREIPVSVNGKAEKLSYKVREGDLIEFVITPLKELKAFPQKVDFDIIYRDRDIAVINKPFGLTVHPARGHEDNTLVNGLLYYLGGNLPGSSDGIRPGIVHRLDKDTAGLMIIALNEKSHRKLTEDFKNRNITKIYHAVVKGNLQEGFGRIDCPIGRSRKNRKLMAVTPDGRPSITEYRVLENLEGHSYIEIGLLTGRTHQIRVHFSNLGHPVAGDRLYSSAPGKYGLTGLALCSKKISFPHPRDGREMSFEIELPGEMKMLLDKLRSGKL
jgi:23S rRNA pseudouridine1911/1915/1917 synthase